jgi:hypothetical protein
MASYGRNFDFRLPPDEGHRAGRHYLDDDARPIGVPVVVTSNVDDLDRRGVELATGDQAKPAPGQGGILLFEQVYYKDVDPTLVGYSDAAISVAPAGEAVQVVNGTETKVVLANTTTNNFLNMRSYAGRTMVAGLGATPTLVAGDKLTPGTGNDTDGYWAETPTAANAWLVITKVDNARGEVEARVNF